jgi:hypothetical protein
MITNIHFYDSKGDIINALSDKKYNCIQINDTITYLGDKYQVIYRNVQINPDGDGYIEIKAYGEKLK